MSNKPFPLPSNPSQWDAWEKSLSAEQSARRHSSAAPPTTASDLDAYTHQSGYGLSPMEQMEEDLMAFETACASFEVDCIRHLRQLPFFLMAAVALLGFYWLVAGAIGDAP